MFNWFSNPTLIGCTFAGNIAGYTGAGVKNMGSNPTFTNCMFSVNEAAYRGGGMENDANSNPTLTNLVFSGNVAYYGGAMFNIKSNPTLTNCTVTGNSAWSEVGGIYNWISSPIVSNCILWGNTHHEIYNSVGTTVMTYSNIEGGWEGKGNIDTDPFFVDAGQWEPGDSPGEDVWVVGDYHLEANSPCIDAGDPNYIREPNKTDLDGLPRVMGERVDMGAYEFHIPIEAELKFRPETLNCATKSNWIKAHLILPKYVSPEDIDVNAPAIAQPMALESGYVKVIGGGLGPVSLEIAFDRAAFCKAVPQFVARDCSIEITVLGFLRSGQAFYGVQTTRIKGHCR